MYSTCSSRLAAGYAMTGYLRYLLPSSAAYPALALTLRFVLVVTV